MNALVVGLGTAGRRHARNLTRIDPSISITGCRTHATGIEDLGGDLAVFDAIHHDLSAALAAQPDVAIIASPASRHLDHAMRLAHAGVHLFVEKPISDRRDGVESLIAECGQRSICLMVGYNLRFDRALRTTKVAIDGGRIGPVLAIRAEVGQYLPDWRPGRDYRGTVTARAGLGGGPLLELSHEFDYLRWLAGNVRSVTAATARVGALDIDVPDVADVMLEFDTGVQGNVHLDMLDRTPIRRCRVVGTQGTIEWDGLARSARLFLAETREWTTLTSADVDLQSDTHVAEMEHYLASVVSGGRPLVTGDDGLQALRIAIGAAESARSRRTITL